MKFLDRIRINLDLSFAIGQQGTTAGRYEDNTGTHHQPAPMTGFVKYVQPEEME